jgi:hypothetical protein
MKYAHLYRKAGGGYWLTVTTHFVISHGETLETFEVYRKSEARRICKACDAKPWNF